MDGTPSSNLDDPKSGIPLLVPLLTPKQRFEIAVLAVLWLTTVVLFWTWWLQPQHVVGLARAVLESLILAWLSFCPLYFLLISYFAKIPNPAVPVRAGLRVALVVTKAPSEPFEVARETMEAMLRQTYPHDTWLADEDPQPETIAWCEANGVRISTRKGRADYHRATWPRRTRCKEGNLAFFYDHYGYANYDFVAQLDADHVPEPTYLEEMLRPFADPRVGYVSAPSICDKNASVSWSARSRLYIEAPMHGIMQAGYTGSLTPLCIGSHYAVRTAALKQIGGLGPELAEDHSTTLFMAANGWRGVHAMNAIAHGDGPATFSDMVTQEFQWSRSLVTLLLQYTPRLFARLPLRLKFQFLFCQFWYPLLALTSLALFVIPVVALLFDITMADVSYSDFVLHAAPPALVLTALILRLASYGHCRPADTRVLSWEAALYPLVRWPWVLIGTVTAVRDWWSGTAVDFRVTPKGAVLQSALSVRSVVPFVFVSVGSALPVLLLGDIQNARGFYLIALLNGIFYTVLILVIFTKHSRETARAGGVAVMTRGGRATWSAILAAVVLLPLAALPFRLPVGISAIGEGGEEVFRPYGWIGLAVLASIALLAIRVIHHLLQRLSQALIGPRRAASEMSGDNDAVGAVQQSGRAVTDARSALWQDISDVLIAWKVVDPDVLEASSKAARQTGTSLSRVLARRGLVDVETLAEAVAVQSQLPRVSLSAEMLEANANLLSQDVCIRHSVFPAGYDERGQLVLAVATPLDAGQMAEIADVAGRSVVQQIARESEITAGLRFLRGSKLAFTKTRDASVPLLGELLVEEGHVKPAAFRSALERYRPSKDGRLGEYLVQRGIVSSSAVTRALSKQRNMMMAA